jgi:hypothetical protein
MGLKSTTVCLGYQQISTLTASIGLTVPVGATMALIVPETQGIRWRDDGTAPTASVGMPVAAGSFLNYDGDLNKIRFIEQTASSKLNVSYYA